MVQCLRVTFKTHEFDNTNLKSEFYSLHEDGPQLMNDF